MPLRHLHISCSCHCLGYLPAWPAYRPVMSTLETVLECCAGLEDRRQEGVMLCERAMQSLESMYLCTE